MKRLLIEAGLVLAILSCGGGGSNAGIGQAATGWARPINDWQDVGDGSGYGIQIREFCDQNGNLLVVAAGYNKGGVAVASANAACASK